MSIWQSLDKAETEKKYELLPEGVYMCEVTDIEVKEQLFPEGADIKVEFSIISGEHESRKMWWTSRMTVDSSPKALSFVKSQICAMAGVKSTSGDPLEVLISCKGNKVMVEAKHHVSPKDETKTYLNTYVKEKLA